MFPFVFFTIYFALAVRNMLSVNMNDAKITT